MPEIKLKIEGKIVSQVGDNPPIVCGNDDYECVVEFDEEWSGHALKVAKIIWNGIYEEVTFGGDRFTLPKVFNTTKVKVGFYSGDLRTTTGVTLGALKSINDENPRHEEEPPEDIVNRILQLIEEGAIQGPQGIQGTPGFFISDYSANPPVPGLIHGFKIEDLYPPMEPKVGELIMSYGNFGIYRVEAVMNGGCIGRCTGSFRGDDYVLTDEDREEIARAASELVNKQSLGLDNVDNTADADKPISKAAESRFKKIEEKIPAAASTTNPLTDKDTVAKMISDRIVDFKGTFSATNLLPMNGVTDGDLAFVTRTDADGNDILDLYMFDGSRRIWVKKTEIYSNKFTAEDFIRIRNAYTKPQNGIPDDDLERDLKERIGYVDPNGTLIDSDVDFGYLQDNIAGLGYVHLPNMIKDAEYSIVVTGKNNFRFEGTGFARENNPIEAVFHNYVIVDNEGCVFVYGSEFPPENAPYHIKLTGPKVIHQKYNPLQTVRDGTAGFTTEMGKDTVATGSFAVAEGWETEALNEFAHAMGNHTKAKAAASLTAGMYTETEDTAMAGMAQGYRTIATGAFQHVEGRYNVRDNEGRYAHIVGAGVADNDRENIEAIDWDGNKKIRGDVYVHANPDSSGGDKLATEKHVNEVVDDKLANADFDTYATKEEVEALNRRVDFQMELSQGQTWDVETDSTEAYEKTLPSGVKMGEVTEIGGRSIVENQLYSGGHESIPTVSGSKYLKQVGDVESIVTGDGADIEFGSVGKSPAYEVDIPETAKQARVDMIAGRSVVLNQLNDHEGSDVPSVSGSKYLKKTHGVKSIVTGDGNPIETAERAASPMSSAAIPANVDKANVFGIGGKSFKWNQMIANATNNSEFITENVTVEVADEFTTKLTSTTSNSTIKMRRVKSPQIDTSHKYYVSVTIDATNTTADALFGFYRSSNGVALACRMAAGTAGKASVVGVPTDAERIGIRLSNAALNGEYAIFTAPMAIDLTADFGPGNEPATVDAAIAAYRALGIDITQPQPYDPGSIKHTAVEEVVFDNMPIDKTSRQPSQSKPLRAGTIIPSLSYNGYTNFHGSWKWENGGFHISGFNIGYAPRIVLSAKPNTEYTLSGTMVNRLRLVATLFDKDGKWISYKASTYEIGYISYTFTTTADTAYIAYGVDANGTQVDRAATDMMIAEGNGTPYSPYNIVYQHIPSSVLALDGYGWSAGTAKNYIYREGGKWWYRQEVFHITLNIDDMDNSDSYPGWRNSGVRDIYGADKSLLKVMCLFKYGDLAAINTNNVNDILYLPTHMYNMTQTEWKSNHAGETLEFYLVSDTPILTDITDIMGDTFVPVDVEEGGNVTLVSETGADVPADIRFIDSTDTLLDMTRTLGSDAPSILEDVTAAYKKVGINPDYQTEYNPGSIVNTSVEDVRYSDSSQQIPDAVLELPGYGWSAGTASNKIIRRGNTWVYRQEVERVDLGTKNWDTYAPNAWKYCGMFQAPIAGKATGYNTSITASFQNTKNSDAFSTTNGRAGLYTDHPDLNKVYFDWGDTSVTLADFKRYISGHILYYKLATPLETDITGLMTGVLEPRDLTAADTTLMFSSNTGAEVENEVSFYDKTDHLVDLTRMFGSSKEPATPAAFHSLLPAYDFAHNPGSINSAAVNKVVWRGSNLIDPEYVLNSDNYSSGINGEGGKFWHVTIQAKPNTKYRLIYSGTVVNSPNVWPQISGPTLKRYAVSATTKSRDITTGPDGILWFGVLDTSVQNRNNFVNIVIPEFLASGIMINEFSLQSTYTPYHAPIEQPIPQAILDLHGYGWSAGTACNKLVQRDNRWIYRQEVGSVDLGTLLWKQYSADTSEKSFYAAMDMLRVDSNNYKINALCVGYSAEIFGAINRWMGYDKAICGVTSPYRIIIRDTAYASLSDFTTGISGKMFYYELATPVETDVTDIVNNALESVKIEAGGTVTFENTNGPDFKIAVPNTTEYIVKLSEV